jgi:hypothetical protein
MPSHRAVQRRFSLYSRYVIEEAASLRDAGPSASPGIPRAFFSFPYFTAELREENVYSVIESEDLER